MHFLYNTDLLLRRTVLCQAATISTSLAVATTVCITITATIIATTCQGVKARFWPQ